jgi:hypothetical protein
MAVTRLWPTGATGQPYGSFAGKASGVMGVGNLLLLGVGRCLSMYSLLRFLSPWPPN